MGVADLVFGLYQTECMGWGDLVDACSTKVGGVGIQSPDYILSIERETCLFHNDHDLVARMCCGIGNCL